MKNLHKLEEQVNDLTNENDTLNAGLATEPVTVNGSAAPGAVYQLEGSNDLSANSWENVGAAVTATGAVSSQTEAVGALLRRYYRCRHVLFE